MSKRRNTRELALKVLFQVDVGHLSPDEALQTWEEEVRPATEDRDYVDGLVRGIAASDAELDEIIAELAEGWKIDRLAKVDKNVLRIALYELIHHPDSTPNTVVNDAVEIVKKYSTDDSGRFVNGILGSYLRRRDETTPASRK